MSTVDWVKISGEEFNQEDTVFHGVRLSIYSDRSGTNWAAYDQMDEEVIDDGLDSAERAKAAAIKYVLDNEA